MKMKILKWLKNHSLNLVGIIFSVCLMMFGIWQLDLICGPPVWHYDWIHPGRYADDPFQCWLWHTTIGEAYDTLLFCIFISFWLLLMSVWTWDRLNLLNLKADK